MSVFFKLYILQNSFSAGAPLRTPLGELTTLPQSPSRTPPPYVGWGVKLYSIQCETLALYKSLTYLLT